MRTETYNLLRRILLMPLHGTMHVFQFGLLILLVLDRPLLHHILTHVNETGEFLRDV